MDLRKISLSQITNIVILCVAGLIALNMFKAQNKKISELRQVKLEQTKKNEILKRIGGLKKRVELYREKFKQRDRHEIINTITSLATASGVRIISLTPVEQVKGEIKAKSDVYDRVFFKVNIQVNGYHQLARFVSSLENAPEMFTVNSLALTTSWSRELKLDVGAEKMLAELMVSEVYFK